MPYNGRSNFMRAILSADLSPNTIKIYQDRISFLKRESKRGIYYMTKTPEKMIPWLHKKYPNDMTAKSYFTVILAIYKYNPGLQEQHKAAYDAWLAEFEKINNSIDHKINENIPSKKQAASFVEFKDICKKRDELPSGSMDRLLLGFFTYMPPVRADLGSIALYKSGDELVEPNYILDNKKLILSQYKTSKFYKSIEKDIPPLLINDLKRSLNLRPREWLFVGKHGSPFNNNGFTKWTSSRFAVLFNKPLTITTIRHSYISSLDFNALSENQKQEIADQMMHSVNTQGKYRLLFKGGV